MVPDDGLPVYQYGRLGMDYKINLRRFYYTTTNGFDTLAEVYDHLGRFQRWVYGGTSSGYTLPSSRFDLRWMHCYGHWTCAPTYSKKLIVKDLYKVGTEQRAIWYFYSPQTEETITCVRNQLNSASGPGQADHAVYPMLNVSTSYNSQFADREDFLLSAFFSDNTDECESGNVEAVSNAATHKYNTEQLPNLLLFNDGNKTGNFSLYNSNDYLLTKTDTAFTESRSEWASNVTIGELRTRYASIFLNGVSQADYNDGKYGTWDIYQATNKTYPSRISAVPATKNVAAPQFGFVDGLTKWSSLDCNNISNIEYKNTYGNVSQKYWPLYYGFPLAQAELESQIKYHITFDASDTYIVYLKYGPFNGTPTENDCINCTWIDSSGTHTGKKLTIVGNYADITIDCDEMNLICMKWRKASSNDYATINLTDDSSYYVLIK